MGDDVTGILYRDGARASCLVIPAVSISPVGGFGPLGGIRMR